MQVFRCSRLRLGGARAGLGLGLGLPVSRPATAAPSTLSRHDGPRSVAPRRHASDLATLDGKWRRVWDEHRKKLRDGGHDDGQQPNWDKDKDNKDNDKSRYVLPMFPYPSGSLHLGHFRVYTIADVVARFHALRGEKVLLPMGWDAFGLPAENAALERGVAPSGWTRSNIAKMKSQIDLMNGSWDWSREITTCDPDFYKHTQKIFLMLHERGLAYQAEAEVNYDPVDKTVLANEQVDANGCSWRSGAKVEKRKLKQWFFRISEFSDDLLNDLDALAEDGAWPEHVLSQQKNWLGKSTGALIKFQLMDLDMMEHFHIRHPGSHSEQATSANSNQSGSNSESKEGASNTTSGPMPVPTVEVFTTRPDTLFGVQYIALASTHPVVLKLAQRDPELQAFLDVIPGLPTDSRVGYLLPQIRAINPLAYHDDTPDAVKASLPVFVAPYVLGDYGEGAVMGVPGHDARDHSFWKEHRADQPIRVVLAASEDESTTAMAAEPFVQHGVMTEHSGVFRGKPSREAGRMMVRMLQAAGLAEEVTKWRLRDWLISRQRYWGTPIPVVHCESCGAVPVPDEQLPVLLPEVEAHWARGKAGNALETCAEFVHTTCPKCKGPARRDTDTMDTFVDSSWYYARFTDPHNERQPFSLEAAKQLPVDVYIGGNEHAILHLLYARFIYKFLATTPLLSEKKEVDGIAGAGAVAEPFRRLITQGMVHGKTYIDPDTGKFLKPDEVDLSDPAKPVVRATSAPATIAFEKMSKSKHNGVDPTEFIAKYGADPTRAHMLFQAPVADILNWDESKIAGVTRWLLKLRDQVVALAAVPEEETVPAREYFESRHRARSTMNTTTTTSTTTTTTTTSSKSFPAKAGSPEEQAAQRRWDADTALWREVQDKIESVTRNYEKIYPLNVVVSDLMTLTNELIRHRDADGGIRRQAASVIVGLMAPITPAFAEECWSLLHPTRSPIFGGRNANANANADAKAKDDDSGSSSRTGTGDNNGSGNVNDKGSGSCSAPVAFPAQDGSAPFLRAERVACAVQINGKLRGVVTIPRAPGGMRGEALGAWIADAILQTEEGRGRFGGGEYDVRKARRTFAVNGGKVVNFVM